MFQDPGGLYNLYLRGKYNLELNRQVYRYHYVRRPLLELTFISVPVSIYTYIKTTWLLEQTQLFVNYMKINHINIEICNISIFYIGPAQSLSIWLDIAYWEIIDVKQHNAAAFHIDLSNILFSPLCFLSVGLLGLKDWVILNPYRLYFEFLSENLKGSLIVLLPYYWYITTIINK